MAIRPLRASACLTYRPVASLIRMSPELVERAVTDSTSVLSWMVLLACTLRSSAMKTEAPSAEMLVALTSIAPVAPTMPPTTSSLPAMLISMLRALSKPLSPPTKPLSAQSLLRPT